MKLLHVGVGIAWILAGFALVAGTPLGAWAIIGAGVLTLWYLPFGTLIGVIQIGLGIVVLRSRTNA